MSDQYMLTNEESVNKLVNERGHKHLISSLNGLGVSCNSDGLKPFIYTIWSKVEKEDIKSNKLFSWDANPSIHGNRNILSACRAF